MIGSHLISNKLKRNNCFIKNNQEILLDLTDFAVREEPEDNLMAAISWPWYNGSYTMAAQPIKSLELHYTMIQFLIIRVITFQCLKMQMVINLAPVSLSNKKVNFYTCPRLSFLKKYATENAFKSISEPLDFKIFWGGEAACPHTPLAARAFGARNLPHLVLKSGYGQP